MALFGRKKVLERVMARDWHGEEELDALLTELRQSRLSAANAIPLLSHGEPTVRQLGVELFVDKPTRGDVRSLVMHLADKRSHVRAYGARVLGRVPAQTVSEGIDGLLGHKSVAVRRLAWDVALSLAGPVGLSYVRRALREAPASVRIVAVQRLGQRHEPKEVLDVLLEAARDPDPQVADAALEQLVRIEEPRVVELMIDRFSRGNAASRARATSYLQAVAQKRPDEMRRRMLRLLGEGEDVTRRLAVEILLSTGDSKDVLLEILGFSGELVGWLRTRILETLQTFGDTILEPALELLQHPDDGIQTQSLVLAERFDDPRIVPPVCRLLHERDWWLRIGACDTLGRLKDRRAVPHLVEALGDEESRWAAIDALAEIGAPESIESLSQLLDDERTEVRLEVIRALGRFTDERGLQLLQRARKQDRAAAVRTQAGELMRALAARLKVDVALSDADEMALSSMELELPVDRLLARTRELGASDLHLTVDEPPMVRIHGKLERLEGYRPLTASDTGKTIVSSLSERHRKLLKRAGEVDFCYYVPEVGRYRGNAYIQRRGVCASYRVIPNTPPTFADLRLPGHLTELLDYHQGIIVVSGPASCGKSTTLSAIINLINEGKPAHVITLEDPVEFVHPIKSALINQREVGTHTEGFGTALRAALREDPDVVMVGEMRDAETIRMALMAAETGHLVIATLHTTNAVQTVDRLVQAFPPEEQPQIRMTLSETLKYVVCQALLPRKDGKGRVAMFEVLKNTFSVATLIRDDKTYQLPNLMRLGLRVGMRTRDGSLMDLVEAGLITPELAWARADSPAEFEGLCDPEFIAETRTAFVAEEEEGDQPEMEIEV